MVKLSILHFSVTSVVDTILFFQDNSGRTVMRGAGGYIYRRIIIWLAWHFHCFGTIMNNTHTQPQLSG
jgi:hypothetical protein